MSKIDWKEIARTYWRLYHGADEAGMTLARQQVPIMARAQRAEAALAQLAAAPPSPADPLVMVCPECTETTTNAEHYKSHTASPVPADPGAGEIVWIHRPGCASINVEAVSGGWQCPGCGVLWPAQ